ncbi:hypothetical protein NEOLEDRAFT_1139085 [Neolentinus lepideus HHB14362 ss-1]|uniref:Uncharacterized protein n=1 Tax=Neolentinus lepideus HHB14362 ss-1 TaxID=1314782 RepID=A0A165PYQ0_9AGAM|nr:hypothetical protein NEOLEDRAFT_1139085 [Neolentinus lepideus HHB14362 ss-1]
MGPVNTPGAAGRPPTPANSRTRRQYMQSVIGLRSPGPQSWTTSPSRKTDSSCPRHAYAPPGYSSGQLALPTTSPTLDSSGLRHAYAPPGHGQGQLMPPLPSSISDSSCPRHAYAPPGYSYGRLMPPSPSSTSDSSDPRLAYAPPGHSYGRTTRPPPSPTSESSGPRYAYAPPGYSSGHFLLECDVSPSLDLFVIEPVVYGSLVALGLKYVWIMDTFLRISVYIIETSCMYQY